MNEDVDITNVWELKNVDVKVKFYLKTRKFIIFKKNSRC